MSCPFVLLWKGNIASNISLVPKENQLFTWKLTVSSIPWGAHRDRPSLPQVTLAVLSRVFFCLAHSLTAVRQIGVSQSHAIFECCLFSVHAQLFFPHRPQSSCSCVQEPFCSIARLYAELMVFSTNYIQLLPLSDFCYMNTKATYSSWLSLVASLYAQVNSWYF